MIAGVKHSGNCGDVWASLPAVREYSRKTGEKVIFYIVLNQQATYYKGAIHPIVDNEGNNVMINEYMYNMMRPLLLQQPYIQDVQKWHEGVDIKVDLDILRNVFVNMPFGSINRWYFYFYPDLACDLSKKWVSVPSTKKNFAKGKIIVNRTQRYNNTHIKYSFLKKYNHDVIFSGTKNEYKLFCQEWDLDIPYLRVNNFMELAQAIKQSKFFIGNQSAAFQLAEGLKHPRILETCNYAPNVIPIGEDAFDLYVPFAMESYSDYLFNKY